MSIVVRLLIPTIEAINIPPFKMSRFLYRESEILSNKRSSIKFCNTAWAGTLLF
jgi:hypothetical protein